MQQKSLGNIVANANVSSSTRVTHRLVFGFPKQGADTQYDQAYSFVHPADALGNEEGHVP